MASNSNVQLHPEWPCKRDKLYLIDHVRYGEFVARAIEPFYMFCGFELIDSNPLLRADGFEAGAYVEIPSASFRARPLS